MGININIYNAVLFYLAWLLCVTGGNYFAIVTCIVALAIHLRLDCPYVSLSASQWDLPCVIPKESLFPTVTATRYLKSTGLKQATGTRCNFPA